MHVGHGLRFHALRGVDDDQRALAGGQRTGDFVGEVHVAGCVEQVQFVFLSVLRIVAHGHGMHLDGDAALALEVHRVEELILPFPVGYGARGLEQTVGQCGLSVVDVGDDAKIARILHGVRPSSILDLGFGVKRRVERRGLPGGGGSGMLVVCRCNGQKSGA